MIIEAIGLFLFIAGLIVGLGAVTVVDVHGVLGRHSNYWTEATTRTHKVTKPLIWIGMIMAIIGGILLYSGQGWMVFSIVHAILAIILILNGIFLSFKVSPFLIDREKEGKSSDLLPDEWQSKISTSFVVSFVSWWAAVILLVVYLVL